MMDLPKTHLMSFWAMSLEVFDTLIVERVLQTGNAFGGGHMSSPFKFFRNVIETNDDLVIDLELIVTAL